MDRYQRGYDQGYDRYYGRGHQFRGTPYGPPFRSSGPDYGRDYYERPRVPYGGYTREPWAGDFHGYPERYDNDFRYGRPRKSQWQTDHGDPYRDRARRTPIRTMRPSYDADSRWNAGRRGPYRSEPGGAPYQGRYDTGWRW